MQYRTNEILEAINSLEFVLEQVDKVSEDISKWKWVIIGLHNTIQNYMVCALRGTENTNVLTVKSSKEWLQEFWNRIQPTTYKWKNPAERLDLFTNLFKKTQTDKMLKGISSRKFEPTQSQIDSVNNLNFYRNEFMHFVPKGWSFSIDEFPNLVVEVLRIIEFLAFESGNINWSDESEKTRTTDALYKIINKLNEQTPNTI